MVPKLFSIMCFKPEISASPINYHYMEAEAFRDRKKRGIRLCLMALLLVISGILLIGVHLNLCKFPKEFNPKFISVKFPAKHASTEEMKRHIKMLVIPANVENMEEVKRLAGTPLVIKFFKKDLAYKKNIDDHYADTAMSSNVFRFRRDIKEDGYVDDDGYEDYIDVKENYVAKNFVDEKENYAEKKKEILEEKNLIDKKEDSGNEEKYVDKTEEFVNEENFDGDIPPSCKVKKGLKTVEILCKTWPTTTVCKSYCTYGKTFDEGIVRTHVCVNEYGVWSKEFAECKPFVDCKLRLVSPGTLNCLGNTLVERATCHVSCERYEDENEVKNRTYTCKTDGTWDPDLPFCAVVKGTPLVSAPRVTEHSEISYPVTYNVK